MPFVAVNKQGEEYIYENKLAKDINDRFYFQNTAIILPKGSIKKLIGRDLTYKDKPVKIK